MKPRDLKNHPMRLLLHFDSFCTAVYAQTDQRIFEKGFSPVETYKAQEKVTKIVQGPSFKHLYDSIFMKSVNHEHFKELTENFSNNLADRVVHEGCVNELLHKNYINPSAAEQGL